VFDGFERLLRETENPRVGVPYSESVKQLLEIMVKHDAKTASTVILTTRLMPQQLQEIIETKTRRSKHVEHFGVRRLTTDDLRKVSAFKELGDEALARACSLCGGHSYALLLVARFLTHGKPDKNEKSARFDDFRHEISRRAPDSRNSAIIKLAIDIVDKRTRGLASELLQRLALFMSPVDPCALDVCFDAMPTDLRAKSKLTSEEVIKELLESRLLLKISGGSDGTANLLTVHPIVRSYVFYKWQRVMSDSLPNFTLAGFTSGNAACHPGDKERSKQVTALFDLFCSRAFESKNFEDRRSLVRSAFGIMRSRMDSNTVPRWTRYDEYIQLGLRLLNLIKTIARDGDEENGTKEMWDYYDRTFAERKQSFNGILYADELAWLYNDIGLALCSEGSMADAYSLWEQGYEIDRITDSDDEGGQYMVQSHLHMSHLFLELGRLRRASQFLTTTERVNASYGDQDFRGRITGYRGLLAHLSGNLDEAETLYADSIKTLRETGRHNVRAESVFNRYWADLLLTKGDLEEAEKKAEIALSLAREGDFPDLEAYARKSRAHVWREKEKNDPRKARAEYSAAMEIAIQHGIKRLQSDIHSELARLALDVGDWETARIRAMESLNLANELSLGLRRTHGLIVLGLAMDAGGNRPLAINYLQHALAAANRQGYYLRGREAEQILQRLSPA
jgi:tetratricopeptide (TPR) repeat protein